MKKLTLLILILATTTAFAQTYSGGSGTETNPYLISTNADMETLANAVNNTGSVNSYAGKYFLLTQDLTGITTVIGNSNSRYFSATLDGGGHTIDVNITPSPNYASNYAGIFGYAQQATIKNLNVTGRVSLSGYASCYAGGICGYAKATVITDCSNAATISVNTQATNPVAYAGGICGYTDYVFNAPTTTYTKITNCSNAGKVSAYAGISEAYSTPSVLTANAGGIAGSGNYATITYCSNSGMISSTVNNYKPSAGNANAGGIVGVGSVTNCSNFGNVTALTSNIFAGATINIYAGGISGSGVASGVAASGCSNAGAVSATVSDTYPRSDNRWTNTTNIYAGGICGNTGGTIANCYNIGTVAADQKVTNITYTGSAYGGGICGYGTNATISNCYNIGNLSSDGLTNSAGICGVLNGGNIRNCVAANTTVNTKQTTTNYNGRIVAATTGTVSNCYALASMTVNANGTTRSSQNANSKDGKDMDIATMQSLAFYSTVGNWYNNIAWDMGVWKICDGEGLISLRWQGIYCSDELIAVTNITDVPTTAAVCVPLTLTGTVTPSNASYQNIVWSVVNAGTTGANINGNKLNTIAAGIVTVRATIINGASTTTNYTKDFNITVPTSGHAFGNWIVTTPATCETAGVETRTCANDASHTETRPIAALGHDLPANWTVRTAATCTTNGLEFKKCSRCSHEITQTIPMSGHAFGNWIVTTPATCETAGVETRTCANDASHTETRPIAALGHNMPANWTIRTTATCTTNGIEFKKCSRCTHEITQTIPMLNCCKVCGEVDCQIEHKQCEVCGEWDCEIEHNTGIAEIEGVSIKIYPNPVKNELIIDRGQLTINSVEIIDLSGKTIFQFNELRNQINVSALPRGIYFVKVETDKGIVTQKFVKE